MKNLNFSKISKMSLAGIVILFVLLNVIQAYAAGDGGKGYTKLLRKEAHQNSVDWTEWASAKDHAKVLRMVADDIEQRALGNMQILNDRNNAIRELLGK